MLGGFHENHPFSIGSYCSVPKYCLAGVPDHGTVLFKIHFMIQVEYPMKRIVVFGFCVHLLMAMNGCGSVDTEFRPVSGVVTYDGVAVEGASIAFIPTDNSGVAATGITNASGKYTLTSTTAKKFGTGAKPGKYLVKITKTETAPDPDQDAFDKGEITYDEFQVRKTKRSPYKNMPGSKNLIPTRYANQLTSKLEATVEDKKNNECDFALEK